MANAPEHAVVRKMGGPRCTCGQEFATDAELIEHITGEPADPQFQLLLAQLFAMLGGDFFEEVAAHIRENGSCDDVDRCICAPLHAYVALYDAGYAIVPIEVARAYAVAAN